MHRILRGTFLATCLGFATAAPAATIYSYTGHLETFDVTVAGLYEIVAYGAAGGLPGSGNPNFPVGNGAVVGGDITLQVGQSLTILVGGTGGNAVSSTTAGGGGGGGSFVVLSAGNTRSRSPGAAPAALARPLG